MRAATVETSPAPAVEEPESFAIAFPIAGKWVRLPSEAKWMRAIRAGDLERSTKIAVEVNGVTKETCLAGTVPELAKLFHEYAPLPEPIHEAPHPAAQGQSSLAAPMPHERGPDMPSDERSGHDELEAEAIWARIRDIDPPQPDLPLPSATKWKAADRNVAYRATLKEARRWAAAGIAGFTALTAMMSGFADWMFAAGLLAAFIWPLRAGAVAQELKVAHQAKKSDWEKLVSIWNDVATSKRFEIKFAELETLKTHYDDLMTRRANMLAQLDTREYQLARHLAAIPLARSRIPGIGAGRLSALKSYGVVTAADISPRVQYLPSFGQAMTSRLMAWRSQCESRLNFDPRLSSRPAEVKRVDQSIAATKRDLLAKLSSGPHALASLRREIEDARERLSPSLSAAWNALQAAKLAWRAA